VAGYDVLTHAEQVKRNIGIFEPTLFPAINDLNHKGKTSVFFGVFYA